MKKNTTLREQIEAARQEINKWPEMIKKATEIQYVAFYAEDDQVKVKESEKKDSAHPLHC